MKVVVDTNVLVSGMINASGPPGRIVDLLQAVALELVVDDRILAEYEDVLRRDRFDEYFSASAREDVIEFLQKESHRIACRVVAGKLPDPGDAPFLEAALTENVPLITGNKKHYPPACRKGCPVLLPSEFLARHLAG